MLFENIYIQRAVLCVGFALYTYLVIELGDAFLRNSRIKKKFRIPVSIINSLLLIVFRQIPYITDSLIYICFFALILIEYLLFYKDKFMRIMMILSSCFVNLLAVRAICVSIFALNTGLSISDVAKDPTLRTVSTMVAFVILNVMMYLIKVFISTERSKAVTEYAEQLIFITSWSGLFSAYLVFVNSKIYSDSLPYRYVVVNQLALAIAILVGYYIVLIFSIMVGQTVQMKRTNSALSKIIKNQQQFRDAIINDALNVYEVNLTQDLITKCSDDMEEQLKQCNYNYSSFLNVLVNNFIFPDDVPLFWEFALRENLMAAYANDKRELEAVYRRTGQAGDYIWVKSTVLLYDDHLTGNVKAFVYIKNIHQQKTRELELKRRAERDSLTNLYNKGTTEMLISNFLSDSIDLPHKGALFIVDVDNFKTINNQFGHAFGDEVLCSLAEELKRIFRNSLEDEGYEDIIGRIGGDEFIVFIKHTSSLELLKSKADCICNGFRREYQRNDMTVEISGSVGIAIFPKNGTDFQTLYKSADVALYISKGKGKNQYTFYNGEAFEGYESKRSEIESLESDIELEDWSIES